MTGATTEAPTAAEPRRIRASIDARALKRVTNFFNGTALDIMTELLQNARRAGATRIDVQTTREGFRVTDNGRGIADPAVLLRFGGSEWNAATVEREDAAGMGIYSLAGLRSRITSRSPTANGGWTVELRPENYRGEREVEVEALTGDQLGSLSRYGGTRIDVCWRDAAGSATEYGSHDFRLWHHLRDDPDRGREEATRSATRAAARYLPVAVRLNGGPVEQHEYLEDVITEHTWRGLRIGVTRRPIQGAHADEAHPAGINVFGHVIGWNPPQGKSLTDIYKTRVDIVDCPELKVVLPARKEVVQTEFLEQLEDECRLVMLKQMTAEQAPTPHHVFETGRKAGLDMALPAIRLEKWEPETPFESTGYAPYSSKYRSAIDPDNDTVVVVPKPDAIEQTDGQILAWADENSTPTENAATIERRQFMTGDYQLAGYAAYDRLWRLAKLTVMCKIEGEAERIPAALHPAMMTDVEHGRHVAQNPDEPPPILPRAKSITLKLNLERQGAADDPERRTIEYSVPFALPGATAYAGGILLTENAEDKLDVDSLWSILFQAYYQENKANADDEMSVDDAESHMRNLAMAVMGDDDDRRREMIGDGTLDAARSYAPHDRETLVRMRWNGNLNDFDIEVAFESRSADADG